MAEGDGEDMAKAVKQEDPNNHFNRDERQWMRRLKTFSGRKNPSSSEHDFDSWEFEVQQLDEETDIDDKVKHRLVRGSLIQPAAGLARSLGHTVDIAKILKVLKSAYGQAADGHELLMRFYDVVQKEEEKPSQLLQRLQGLLRRVVDSGEILHDEEFKVLSKQFTRACNDETLLIKLDGYEYDDFGELFCGLVEKETRLKDKNSRFGDHHSESTTTKRTQATAKSQTTADASTHNTQMTQLLETVTALSVAVDELKRERVTEVEADEHHPNGRGRGTTRTREPSGWRPRSRAPSSQTRSRICYHCGESGHFFRDCTRQGDPRKVCDFLKGGGRQDDNVHQGN
ncbi:uncharacterized protein LOC135484798 [Lineus longissimus]|uniref:uncharacterized protein LOC135484798 n=1 Tax=Lineus longissimus TaxID=88925 RepID=UPI00315DED62